MCRGGVGGVCVCVLASESRCALCVYVVFAVFGWCAGGGVVKNGTDIVKFFFFLWRFFWAWTCVRSSFASENVDRWFLCLLPVCDICM